jgi:pantothenate kinase
MFNALDSFLGPMLGLPVIRSSSKSKAVKESKAAREAPLHNGAIEPYDALDSVCAPLLCLEVDHRPRIKHKVAVYPYTMSNNDSFITIPENELLEPQYESSNKGGVITVATAGTDVEEEREEPHHTPQYEVEAADSNSFYKDEREEPHPTTQSEVEAVDSNSFYKDDESSTNRDVASLPSYTTPTPSLADDLTTEPALAAGVETLAEGLAERLLRAAGDRKRFMVAIAGAPGAGKSTLSASLVEVMAKVGTRAIVVPMDGFHFDDTVLDKRGHRSRKGASFTFDHAGFEVLLRRIRNNESEIAIPVFDRDLELSRANGAIIDAGARIVIVEGNYLLLREDPWCRLHHLFDYRVFLDVPMDELKRRLRERMMKKHGHSDKSAEEWLAGNDLLNVYHVLGGSVEGDLRLVI